MSEEQTWLLALSSEQLGQASRAARVKVDGFRNLSVVPRPLLERQIMMVLGRQRGHDRSAKLRSALGSTWRERYPALFGLLKAGVTTAAGDDRPEVQRWGDWLAGLCRTFGRAPVQMGVQVVDLPWADNELLAKLEPYWPVDLPLMPEPVAPEAGEPAAEESAAEVQSAGAPPEWRLERREWRAKLKSLTQENQALQRARTSAEHRAAHFQTQVEQVRAEMEALANRTDWPPPKMLVQRLIRGLMDARRQILDLEIANAELRLALGQPSEAEAAAEMAEPEEE